MLPPRYVQASRESLLRESIAGPPRESVWINLFGPIPAVPSVDRLADWRPATTREGRCSPTAPARPGLGRIELFVTSLLLATRIGSCLRRRPKLTSPSPRHREARRSKRLPEVRGAAVEQRLPTHLAAPAAASPPSPAAVQQSRLNEQTVHASPRLKSRVGPALDVGHLAAEAAHRAAARAALRKLRKLRNRPRKNHQRHERKHWQMASAAAARR